MKGSTRQTPMSTGGAAPSLPNAARAVSYIGPAVPGAPHGWPSAPGSR